MSSNDWGPFLAGNLASRLLVRADQFRSRRAWSAWAYTKPAINIKANGPNGLYNKFGVQVASSFRRPFGREDG